MPGASGSRAPSSTTPSTSSAASATPTTSRSCHASELRELGELTLGRAARAGRRVAAGLRELGRRARRPRRRLPAEHPRGARRLPRHRVASARSGRAARPTSAPRSVVDRFAQIEPKVLFASTATATAARTSTAATSSPGSQARDADASSAPSSSPTSTPTPDLSPPRRARSPGTSCSASGAGAELDFEQRALRPPALGPLLLRHHRPAEGDRPGPRRDPARAPEEAQPPRRRPGRRPRLLVHHHRLDDVELPRRRPAHPRLDRPLRRQPRPPRHGRALGPRRARRDHLLRHQRQLHRRLHEGRRRARRAAATSRACARSARPARRSRPRASTGSTSTSARDTWLFSTSGGTDVCTAFVGGVPLLPVYRGELQGRALGAAVEAFDEDGNSVVDEVGELVITEPMPSMPLFFWGDDDGSRYRASYFEHLPGRLAPRRLDRDHLARHRGHLRPLRLDHQPPGRAHGDERDLPRGAGRRPRSSTRSSSTSRGPGTEGWMPLFVVLREGADARRRARPPRSSAGSASSARPATSPTRSSQIAEVPRTLSGKVLEVPVKRILTGHAARAGGEPRLARQPRGARLLRRAGRQARRAQLAARPQAPDAGGPSSASDSSSPSSDRNASTTSWSNWLPARAWSSALARFGENALPVAAGPRSSPHRRRRPPGSCPSSGI